MIYKNDMFDAVVVSLGLFGVVFQITESVVFQITESAFKLKEVTTITTLKQ